MKSLSIFSKTTLILFYFRNKEYIIPAGVIAVALFVFVNLIPPQIRSLLTLRQSAESTRQRIQVLKSNITVLSEVEDNKLDDRFLVSTSALPGEKNFDELFEAISNAAAKSSVAVDDYGLNVGGDDLKSQEEVIPVKIGLTIRGGGVAGTQEFLKTLSTTFPLSEVESVQVNEGSTSLVIHFFYKPFASTAFNANAPVANLGSQDIETLNVLSNWQASVPTASPSSFP